MSPHDVRRGAGKPSRKAHRRKDDPLVPVRIHFGDLVVETTWPASALRSAPSPGTGDDR